jgi:hypothetical protein
MHPRVDLGGRSAVNPTIHSVFVILLKRWLDRQEENIPFFSGHLPSENLLESSRQFAFPSGDGSFRYASLRPSSKLFIVSSPNSILGRFDHEEDEREYSETERLALKPLPH